MTLLREVLHSGPSLEVRRVVCRPSHLGPGELEESREAMLVMPLAGTFHRHLGRRRTQLADPCGALFLRPGEPYRVSHADPAGDLCLSITFRGEALARWLDAAAPAVVESGEPRLPAAVPSLGGEALALRSLLAARLRRRLAGPLEVEESAGRLLLAALRQGGPAAAGRRPAASDGRQRVEAARVLLEDDPGRAWSLGELAAEVGGSPFHLTTLFRRETGLPLHRYLVLARLARACEELADGRRRITDIAMDLGFATPSHFAAAFRRATGLAPSSLRVAACAAAVNGARKILTAQRRPRR